ncbi:TolC family protein [Nevskia soli]|uniref:TolC family protein n=1 Tax=Nevskia soli TaxID=418856 RepID=UPI00056CC4FD|nr:TolC family protein [Nevskia soli]
MLFANRLPALPLLLLALTGCASYSALPLDKDARPRDSLEQLRHEAPLPARLGVDDIALLALLNNPDLLAARAQRGVARAQLLAAGILPNPSLSASYGFLLGGPGTMGALSAGLSQDLRSLVTLSAKRGAARQSAREIDASLLWQEWQTIAKARLQAVDLIEGERQCELLQGQLSLLQGRLERSRRALDQGDSTLAALVPELTAAADARKQLDDLKRQQETRRRDLDTFLGLSPQVVLPLDPAISLPPLDAAAVNADLPGLADRRPDLVALQLGYGAQEEKVRGAILAQFPLLSLGVSGGHDTSDVRTLGPQITMDLPIFDRNQGNIALERATRQQLHDEFGARLAAARSEVQALLADQALLLGQYGGKQAQLAELERSAHSADTAFRGGDLDERSYIDLVTARNAKQQEVLAMEQSLLQQQVAIATLSGAGMPPVSLDSRAAQP